MTSQNQYPIQSTKPSPCTTDPHPFNRVASSLSSYRETSSIPSKRGVWMYPSEQQFYRTTVAKGAEVRLKRRIHTVKPIKTDSWKHVSLILSIAQKYGISFVVLPEDMHVVVAVHNAINEKAWEKIMEYEKLHQKTCQEPTLIRFSGIPEVKTPKARLRKVLGYVEPFDTHEWLIDRCGTTVRYLIDYYEGPGRPISGAPIAVHIDARPQLSAASLVDRIRMSWKFFVSGWK